MHISGPNGLTGKASAISRKKKAGSSDFNKAFISSEENVEEQGGVLSPAPLSAMGVVMAAQNIDNESSIEETKERGEKLLSYLDSIRHGLLLGTIPMDEIEQMQKELQLHKAISFDPNLNSVIKDIEIRLAVELAKMSVL